MASTPGSNSAAIRIELRPEAPGDLAFLAVLYASTREDELSLTDWPLEQKQLFVAQQFAAQTLHYDRYFPDAKRTIILVAGERAGRLYLLATPGDLRIVDISLLPCYRGKGIGTGLIRDVFRQAEAAKSKVSIHVEVFNPAKRLYERLGFRAAGENGVYQLMEWSARD